MAIGSRLDEKKYEGREKPGKEGGGVQANWGGGNRDGLKGCRGESTCNGADVKTRGKEYWGQRGGKV